MSRLDPPTYLEHIRDESQRFRDVLADCDPAAAVPSCPDWRADDLLWHLGEVQHWWTWMVVNRPKGPDDYPEPERPADHGRSSGCSPSSRSPIPGAFHASSGSEPL